MINCVLDHGISERNFMRLIIRRTQVGTLDLSGKVKQNKFCGLDWGQVEMGVRGSRWGKGEKVGESSERDK